MIFVDTNIYMYAVGRPHPLREQARRFFLESTAEGTPIATSVEVLQELLHAYLPVGRLERLDAAMRLAVDTATEVWSVTVQDVRMAHSLVAGYPALGARDLIHLASCRRRDVARVKTFDRTLAAAFA